MNRLLRVAAALVGGAAIGIAFPPWGLWPAAIIGIALVVLAVGGLRFRWALLLGLMVGVVSFAINLSWIRVVGSDAWIALTVFSALPIAIACGFTALVMRLRAWPWWVALVWVAVEAVRDRIPLGGWPWGRLGYSQADAPWLSLASLGGAVVLTFAVAVTGSWLAWACYRWYDGSRGGATIAVAAVVIAPLAALLIPLPTAGQTSGGPASATVAVIQGDVPNIGLGFADRSNRRAVLDNHVNKTIELAEAVSAGDEPQPEAVIWPENASDLDPLAQADAALQITRAARAIAAPILVGAVTTNPDDPNTALNVGIVWDPETGPGETYVKQHPVPFGEYVPARDFLTSVIGRFDLVPRDFVAGTEPGVLQLGPVQLGDIICFEVAYDDLVRETVVAGARMLAIQTNNATYTGLGQSEQQLAMARIRAVEHGRATAVAATNGISAIFAPDGEITGSLPEQSAGWLVQQLPLRDAISISDRIGFWPEVAAGLATLALLIMGFRTQPGVFQRSVPGEYNS